MAVSAILGSLLFIVANLATAHGKVGLNSSRRLTWTWDAGSNPIWGGCHAARDAEGCSLSGGFKCSDRLSPGPDDADVQIKLQGLPPSTAQDPVHLQFWSPRKSPTQYDPLVSLKGCSIYKDMLDAYPQYDAVDFNGGNIRVSEEGEAIIRVRTPATYQVWWEGGGYEIPVPHIHLRLCHGNNFAHTPAHGVFFSEATTWLVGTNTPLMYLDDVSPYTDRVSHTPVDHSAPKPVKIVVGCRPGKSTTLPPSSTAAPKNGELINAARERLDLDALEFSPVYQCLLERAFFDHYTADCVTECSDDAVVKHGQCARKKTDDKAVDLTVTWKLEINCGEPCWHEKKLVALHHLRLSVATHLKIPFQEVKVDMGFVSSDSRRLAGAKTGYLTVKVASDRLTEEEGIALLEGFVKSTEFISQLLGLKVVTHSIVPKPDGQFLSEPTEWDPNDDPYEPAYNALDPARRGGSGQGVFSFLPTTAIVGVAAGVVVVLGVVIGTMLWRRRRAQQAHDMQRAQEKVAEKVADPEPTNNDADLEKNVVVVAEPKAVVEPEEATDNRVEEATEETNPASMKL